MHHTCTSSLLLLLSLLIFNCIPAECRTGLPKNPATRTDIIEGISVSASSILDAKGNVLGVTIPLKRAGRLYLFEATIDNVIGNFILDTGASGLVLNTTYFRNAIEVADEEGGGVTGSTARVARINVRKLMINELAYTNVSADVTPLGHLENRRGIKILGLFGMSLMKNIEMVIDFRNNELQIFKLDKTGKRYGPVATDEKFDLVQKIEEFHNVLFVKAIIGGKELDFCLDTGAESNVLNINANKKVLSTVTITRRSSLNGVGQDQGEVLYGTLSDFSMGNRQMVPMETILCTLTAMSNKYGYPIDGMLGYDFFAKGKIFINLVKKEMGICLRKEEKR